MSTESNAHPHEETKFEAMMKHKIEEYPQLVAKMIPARATLLIMLRAIMSGALEAAGEAPHLLVVGAGGGEEILQLADNNPTWRFTGVDLNEEMINTGKHRIQEKGLTNEITWFQAPIADLGATGFDAATCILTAHFIPDDGSRQQFYTDIHSRLKPGAVFIIQSACYDREANPEGTTPLEKLSEEDRLNYNLHFEHALLRGGPADNIATMRDKVGVMPVVSETRERELLETAGFSNVRRFFQLGMLKGWVALA